MYDTLGYAIQKMALVGSEDKKKELRDAAKGYTLGGWKMAQKAKLGGVGALTGAAGGPVGLALEGLDIAYLMAASGRACYGIGHIKGRDIDYDADLPLILAIWCGAAEAGATIAAGKVGIKVAGKASLGIAANVAGKLAAKSAMKFTSKIGAQVVGFAATKLAAKLAAKMSVKWIPIIGGVVGGGINVWIMGDLMHAADEYYSNDYVVLSKDLASNVD